MNVRTDIILVSSGLRNRIVSDFFRNSAQFPAVVLILEFLTESQRYFLGPDPYLLLVAALIQSTMIGHWQTQGRPRPFVGNLIGPIIYTIAEVVIDGPNFFSLHQHTAYWVFAAMVGVIQWAQMIGAAGLRRDALIVVENVIRACMLLVTYAIFEAVSQPQKASLHAFMSDDAHQFLAIVIPLLGVLLGVSEVVAKRADDTVRALASKLRLLSDWSFGASFVDRAMSSAAALKLHTQQRAVVFMDIRGFTSWCETRAPDQIIAMLNLYYEASERMWGDSAPIKVKFTADEVMAVFAESEVAVAVARRFQAEIAASLAEYQLTVGIGVHVGAVVEGVMGSGTRKGFDVIGDSVNTAKRLCDAAQSSELLVSAAVKTGLVGSKFDYERREIVAKGKAKPITVYALQAVSDTL